MRNVMVAFLNFIDKVAGAILFLPWRKKNEIYPEMEMIDYKVIFALQTVE